MNRKALVILALFGLASIPASAICLDAPPFGSTTAPCPSSPDSLCAFVNPIPGHTSMDMTGYWWNLVTGNPLPATGADNGSWTLQGDYPYIMPWLFDTGVEGRTVVYGTWWSYENIDGCYSTTGGFADSVNVLALFDQADGVGYHCAVGVMRTGAFSEEWDYGLSDGGVHDGMDKPLMPIPRPQVLSWTKDAVSTTLVLAGLTADIPGVYHDANVTNAHIVKGVKLYVVAAQTAPVDRTRAAWGTAAATYLFDGVNESLTLACPGTYHLAYSVMYDSNFESPIVGPATMVTACGDTLADPGDGKKFRIVKDKKDK